MSALKTSTFNIVTIALAGLLAGLLGGCRDPLATKHGLVNEGDRHFYRAEYLQAIGAYKEAVKQDPSDADVLVKIGESHMYPPQLSRGDELVPQGPAIQARQPQGG